MAGTFISLLWHIPKLISYWMATTSVLSLASQLFLNRSFICSTDHEFNPFRKTIQTPRRKYSALPININMNFRTTVYSEDAGDNALQSRRIGKYHFNLWDDHFIHSLSTPYGVGNSYYFHSHFHLFISQLINPILCIHLM